MAREFDERHGEESSLEQFLEEASLVARPTTGSRRATA